MIFLLLTFMYALGGFIGVYGTNKIVLWIMISVCALVLYDEFTQKNKKR